MIAHRVGNKSRGEGVGFSTKEIDAASFADVLNKLLSKSFKTDDYYYFDGDYDLDSNPVYSFIKSIFNNPKDFKSQSNHIAKHLYESSVHPKVKTGEMCVFYMSDVDYNESKVDALAIIKSESHQEVLQLNWGENGFEAQKTTGISLSKIEKGAFIYNVSHEKGYVVSIVDKVSRNDDSKYWKDTFLRVKSYNSSRQQTLNLVDVCNEFVKTIISKDETLPRLEKAMIGSRAKEVLLNNESDSMTLKDYAAAVFKNHSLESKFTSFVESSDKADEIDVETIIIDRRALNKKKSIMSTIKLDDNFELYVNGAEDRIIKGYDPDAALNYYKLYFEKEK